MPDQLAHYLYGREMVRRAGLARRIDADSAVFRAGTFGPDPLFNDPRGNIRRLGLGMHKRPGREPMELLRRAVRDELPQAEAYAAGFFCHYALDRICHPLLYGMERRGEAKHVATETAFDRILYKKKLGKLRLSLSLGDDACRAAVQIYPSLSPTDFQRDINLYLVLRRIMSSSGTPLAAVSAAVLPKYRGLVPFSTPDAQTQRGIERLEQVMRDNIDLASEQLKRFFDAIDRNTALDPWLDADFAGNIKR